MTADRTTTTELTIWTVNGPRPSGLVAQLVLMGAMPARAVAVSGRACSDDLRQEQSQALGATSVVGTCPDRKRQQRDPGMAPSKDLGNTPVREGTVDLVCAKM